MLSKQNASEGTRCERTDGSQQTHNHISLHQLADFLPDSGKWQERGYMVHIQQGVKMIMYDLIADIRRNVVRMAA